MNTCVSKNSTAVSRKKSSLYRAVMGGSIGNILEWFDYGLYGYFAPIISSLYFPSSDALTSLMLTFIIFGVGFVMRPLGGIFFGYYADKMGRCNVLSFTVIMMGIATACIGLIPTYAQIGVVAPILLALFRLIQGFSTGGEWGSCTSFLAEYTTQRNRGFIVSWSMFSIGAGSLLGSLAGVFLTAYLSPEDLHSWGWRIPFLCGVLIAAYGYYLRRNIAESPLYQDAVQNNDITETPLKEVAKNYKREVIVTFGIVIGWTVTYWVIMSYMPTYITKILNFSMASGFQLNTILLLIFMIAVPFAGILSDKVGRKPVMIFAATGFVLLSYPLFKLMSTTSSFETLMFVLGIFAILEALFCGAAVVAIAELFPTKVRCSALGTIFNFTVAVFGGTAPFIVTWLTKATGDNMALTYYLIPGAGISLLVLLLLAKETYKNNLN